MQALPDYAAFEAGYREGRSQVLWTTLVADLETPVSAFLKLAQDRPNAFLFESVEGGATIGRYSFIGFKPDVIWRCFGDKAEINRVARYDSEAFEPQKDGVFESLQALVAESRIALPDELPPMASGLFGYMGYDTVRLMEHLPTDNRDVLKVPDGVYMRPTVVAIFDRVEDTLTVVTPIWPSSDLNARAAYAQACERLSDVVADFQRGLAEGHGGLAPGTALPDPVSNMAPAEFRAMVARAKEYILAGDIFQVVLSQRFSVPFTLSPFSLYRALRRLNPSPFLVYLNLGGYAVVASSPEILVRVRDDVVTIRPIAGTRRRGANAEEDRELAADLLADPKECAEHLMLLDLGRNDVGRVAEIGSVKVTEQMTVEYYSHVMHIVSNVDGKLDPKFTPIQALIAGFPAGTVSGAPKVRAMEIIDELENERRGIYAGAIGYFGANGSMDTCIALRTAVVKDGIMYVQAGAGIVADSDPESEHQECRNKARALVRAAEEAVNFALRKGNQ
ncbi:MAG TPA: anthranilate synthase component I [Kiloniellaceae bacterium]|nr:anthranilate synthase component I [Kiloniellaceae bacterium]